MPSLGADFGIILAYLVPGYITLWAFSYLFKPIANLFQTAGEGERRVSAAFALTIVCLGTGMFLSIFRAGTIDKSFERDVTVLYQSPQSGSVKWADPHFDALMCSGHRESFLLAEATDKRPYQFYGNMALAITLAAAIALWKMRKLSRRIGGWRFLLVVTVWAIMFVTFYSGARLSHYRFMSAVEAINSIPCPPPKAA